MKAELSIGYTRKGLYDSRGRWAYQEKRYENLVGCDVTIKDGLGNTIEVNAREGDIGYRVSVNGKEIANEGTCALP